MVARTVVGMQYGLGLGPVGPWGDPRTIAELAGLAEASGWDGVFVEDYVFFHDRTSDTYDPWVTLAAIALATERIRIGTLVTPVPGRRVWKLAAEAVAIDRLSGGRLTLGVGLGDLDLAAQLGEEPDPRVRAAMLDESLAALDLLWSGEPVTYWGEHVHLDGVMLRPRPVQRPRIPIVVGGSFERRGPRRRALRWDGCCLYGVTADNRSRDLTPEDVRTLRAGAGDRDFMIIIGGRERRPDLEVETRYVTSLADAGADWWLEYIETTRTLERAREVIRSGPVRATT